MHEINKNVWIKDGAACAVIVAHPDDETLWAGGTILMHPQADWTIITICRKNDADRAPKFHRAIETINVKGIMGDLDDGPEQIPLDTRLLQRTIIELLPSNSFDLILTHSPDGEYTRHRRHEEVGNAVMTLWQNEKLLSKEIWKFAYEDGNGSYFPKTVQNADLKIKLPSKIWQSKYDIITKIYGFGPNSFEAKTTPRNEAFWRLKSKSVT